MKKFAILTFIILLFTAVFPGCNQADVSNGGKISIICTVFPQYDWTRQILGDEADHMELTLLLRSKADLHNYQPSVEDIVKISTCDLFIYVGGESDKWTVDVLKEAANPDMIAISLLDVLGDAAKPEEIVEGMEDDEDDDGDEDDYDEHIWLSLKNAEIFCSAITETLSYMDADNTKTYENNMDAYIKELKSLDGEYQAVTGAAPVKTLLFGDRFPFRYLVDDYGLNYYAAFPGCSAETEASFDTIISLARKVDELDLDVVMVTESADQSIAKTIISNTEAQNQHILVLDSMQSVTSNDVGDGTTYLDIMKNNLNVLQEALY